MSDKFQYYECPLRPPVCVLLTIIGPLSKKVTLYPSNQPEIEAFESIMGKEYNARNMETVIFCPTKMNFSCRVVFTLLETLSAWTHRKFGRLVKR